MNERLTDSDVFHLLRSWNVRNSPPLRDDELQEAAVNGRTNGAPPADKPPTQQVVDHGVDISGILNQTIGHTYSSTFEEYPDDTTTQTDDHFEKIAKTYRLEPAWSLGQLLEADLRESFIIDGVLIENQPCLMGGAFKTLKTTIDLDLAMSLCSGAKFLNHFEVLHKKRVLFCSAKSGKQKIRKTIYALAQQKGISLAQIRDNDSLRLSWWVPKINTKRSWPTSNLRSTGLKPPLW